MIEFPVSSMASANVVKVRYRVPVCVSMLGIMEVDVKITILLSRLSWVYVHHVY